MSAAQQFIPYERIKQLLPCMTNEEAYEVMRRVRQVESFIPVEQAKENPVNAEELVRLESDCSYYWKKAWEATYPVTPLVWSWHYELIAEYLTLIKQRKLRRVIFNVPPRTLKSTFITSFFPTWVWLTEPTHNFLCASYSRDLATDHSIWRRNLITSPWYQSLFGDRYQLSSDRNLTTQFMNDKGGQMLVTSSGSGAEGRGGDTIILDDPMSNSQALSESERKTVNDWISGTLMQRLNNPATGSIVIVMQRLHELDTTGYVMERNPGEWKHVVIPLEAEDDEKSRTYSFPLSGRKHVRPKNDVLEPERFTPEVVATKKKERLVYAGQFQQRPAPLEGNLIKRSEVRYHSGHDPVTGALDEQLPELRKFHRIFVTVDAAFKDLDTSDYVAVGVVGVLGRKRFLLDVVNEHLDINGTELAIRNKREQWRATAVIVEDKANGPAVVQRLKNSLPGVQEITPEGGKIARMFAAAPEWQAGDWYVDRNAAWAEPFVEQVTMFPTAKHDDMADMMTQAAIWLQKTGTIDVWARL